MMIQKSKFLPNIWFVEIDNRTADFNISKEPIMGHNVLRCFTDGKAGDINVRTQIHNLQVFYGIRNLKNPKGLFLTKLATEDDWKKIIPFHNYLEERIEGYEDYNGKFVTAGSEYHLQTATESGLSLLKAEGLDFENKNYLIIKEDGLER